MSTKEIPVGEHWSIVTDDSVSIPGDERSRTNPGHGYPAHTREYITYEAYLSEEDMRKAAETRLQTPGRYRKSFICIHVVGTTRPKIRAEIDWT